jgi:uncharacterized protein
VVAEILRRSNGITGRIKNILYKISKNIQNLNKQLSNNLMPKQIYINLITKDLAKSTAFYQSIGCVQNDTFSGPHASAMTWSEDIIFMLLTEEFTQNFNDGKTIADQKKSVGAFYALSCDSREAVDTFCANGKAAGGRVYANKFNEDNAGDFMYTFEVEDPDGYILEPMFMDVSKFTQS